MSNVQIYHNPKCSKSRQTLELLRLEGIEPEIIEYLKTPLTESGLLALVRKIDTEPKSLVRTKEDIFKQGNFDIDSAESIAKVLAENPKLMERPVVVKGDKAVLGRPPENVKSLL